MLNLPLAAFVFVCGLFSWKVRDKTVRDQTYEVENSEKLVYIKRTILVFFTEIV